MAARIHPLSGSQELVELRRLGASDLDQLLEEETAAWSAELQWDFRKSAELVRRFVEMRALEGTALVEDGKVLGYAYYVVEDSKALIGDLYVRREARTTARENALMARIIDSLSNLPAVARVEAQLMMLGFDAERKLPLGAHSSGFERNFMRLALSRGQLETLPASRPFYIEHWSDFYQEAVAQAISESYEGHVDSLINDQYRTPHGARRFLQNIIQYPGCGTFFRPASFLAFDGVSGKLCGISLASMVAHESGHVTQICVTPGVRGKGVGRNLLNRTLLALRQAGCRSASLTCTSGNRRAVELYEQVGFTTTRRFAAFVWDFK
jgi:ribosomal protein S18 acetylase RimI-like enzyme